MVDQRDSVKIWSQRLSSVAHDFRGAVVLWVVSCLESVILIFPVDPLLMALVPLSRCSWYALAALCTLGSLFGGFLAYALGRWSMERWARDWLASLAGDHGVWVNGRFDIELPAYLSSITDPLLGSGYLFEIFDQWSAWVVLIFAVSPLPYKVVAVASGVAGTHSGIFLLASALGRSLRFFTVAFLVHCYADKARQWVQRWILTLTLLLIAAFVVCLLFTVLSMFS